MLLQCLFMLYCMIPVPWNGSVTIYTRVIRPFVLKHQKKVDQTIDQAADIAQGVMDQGEFILYNWTHCGKFLLIRVTNFLFNRSEYSLTVYPYLVCFLTYLHQSNSCSSLSFENFKYKVTIILKGFSLIFKISWYVQLARILICLLAR